jgi:hypothetical protein
MFSLFRPLKQAIYDAIYKIRKKRDDDYWYFRIHTEPSLNHHIESFPKHKSFVARFVNENDDIKFEYDMRKQLPVVRFSIEKLHLNLITNIRFSDELQSFLELHPHRDDITREYERYNHLVKEDLSSIRKLEAFVKVYDPSYVSKPEYSGEERDNVNTY